MADVRIPDLPLASSGTPESIMVIVNFDVESSGITNSIYFSSLTQQFSGTSGISGLSGVNGISGINGESGLSGISGINGESGISGTNGESGLSGMSGESGLSGMSGESGLSGMKGNSSGAIYFLNTSVNQTPYKEFSLTADNLPESVITATSVSSNATVLVQSYMTPVGVPGLTSIPAGFWTYYLHCTKENNSNTFYVFAEVYKIDTGNTETLLFTTDGANVTGVGNDTQMVISDVYQTGYTLDITDRIISKIYTTNLSLAPKTFKLYSEGSTHYSYAQTSLGYIINPGPQGISGLSGISGITPSVNYSQSGGGTRVTLNVNGSPQTIVSTSITTTGRPVRVSAYGDAENSGPGYWTKLQLWRDSSAIGAIVHAEGSNGSENSPFGMTYIDNPAAGTYTYYLKANEVSGGAFNFGESTAPIINVQEL